MYNKVCFTKVEFVAIVEKIKSELEFDISVCWIVHGTKLQEVTEFLKRFHFELLPMGSKKCGFPTTSALFSNFVFLLV